MKQRLLIIGCSLFEDITIEQNKFIPTYRSTAINLASDYLVDNFSLKNMTAARALRLIKGLPPIYESCILALGEADLANLKFFDDLKAIIDTLKKNLVKPVLVALPTEFHEDLAYRKIQDAIIKIADKETVDLIYTGQLTNNFYHVSNFNEYQLVIKQLCC